jgi:hypothetical protein
MKSISTRCVIKLKGKEKNKDGKPAMPCKQTMNFLTQFARGYHVEPVMQKDLRGFVLN